MYQVVRCKLEHAEEESYVVTPETWTREKGRTMKLTTTTQVSVDGVMQGPRGPEEDERAVFERARWPHFDNEARTAMPATYHPADALLSARPTSTTSPPPLG